MTENESSSQVTKSHEGFERAFQLVGGHGRYQWTLLGIVCFQLGIMVWHHVGYVFLGSVPNHWCHIPELSRTNWTLEQKWIISLPTVSEQETVKWNQCHHYDLNYAELLEKSEGDFDRALEFVNESRHTDKTLQCSSWEYDHSIYVSTVATEFNLVCQRRYLAATIQATYMAGGGIGTLTFGSLSDKLLGRRNSVLVALCLVIFPGIAAAFANSYTLFVILRFIIAIGVAGCMQNCNVLVVENSCISHRAMFVMLAGIAFGVGYAIMPVYAYFLRDWSSLQLGFSLTSLLLLIYIWILPDSPRWLAANKKNESALRQLEQMAKRNKMPQPNKSDLLRIIKDCQEIDDKPGRDRKLTSCEKVSEKLKIMATNFKYLISTREMKKRTLILWVLFFTVAFVYYGFAFSTNLTSDPFILVSLGGLMEIPACVLAVPFLSKWGRRPTTSSLYILTGVCAFAIAAVPADYETIRVILFMSGKLFVASLFTVVYLLASELYPTATRTTGMAAAIVLGRVGSITSPYVVDLMTATYQDLPCIIFGVVSLVAGGVALLLPETRNSDIADQVHQLQEIQLDTATT